MDSLDLFSRGWVGSNIPGVRDFMSTYSGMSCVDLPPLATVPPRLQWLVKLPSEIARKMQPYRPSREDREVFARNRAAVLGTAESQSIGLPPSLRLLLESFELQDRIPSCTACYFDLPPSILGSPFRNGDFILRFLNDQQCCICWYVYLPRDKEAFVIASGGVGDQAFLEEMDFSSPEAVSEAKAATLCVATSLDEFLYRFWLENMLWFKIDLGLPLNEQEEAYVEHYRDRLAD